jgi:hypothetical protein
MEHRREEVEVIWCGNMKNDFLDLHGLHLFDFGFSITFCRVFYVGIKMNYKYSLELRDFRGR